MGAASARQIRSWEHRDLTADAVEDYKTWCSGAALDATASQLLRSWKTISETVAVRGDGTSVQLGPVKPATVNLDLALLSKAYNYGIKKTGVITVKPHVAKYTKRELAKYVRQGFLVQAEYDRIMQLSLPLWFKAMICVAYTCGNRSGELKNLQVRQVNFLARNVRLYAGETKNGDGRLLGMTEEMFHLLKAACWGKQPEDYVFSRDDRRLGGRKVGDIRKLWADVLKRAGVTRHITLHDFRRSAARNALNRGMTEQEVMAMGGWKSREMLDRYNVRREGELVAAMAKIEAGAKLERQLIAQQQQELATQAAVGQPLPSTVGPQLGHAGNVPIESTSQVVVN